MIDRIAHIYFTHTDDRGGGIPVAASARRLVTMPAASLSLDADPHRAPTSLQDTPEARRLESIAAALEASIPRHGRQPQRNGGVTVR